MTENSSKSKRVAKVEKSLQEILANYFIEISSLFEGALVSVIRVNAAADLRHAQVFVSVYGGDADFVFDVLDEKRTQMQHKISKSLPMKFCPKLKFILDGSVDQLIHISEIVNSNKNSNKED